MKQSDDVFESLNWSIFQLLPDLAEEKPRNAAILKVLFYACLVLLFVGDEAVKFIFRKGFGTKGIHWWKAILCIIAFGTLSASSVSVILDNPGQEIPFFSPFSFLLAGLFNATLAIFFFYKWAILPRNKKAEKYYRGDSTMLSVLMKKGWSQARIQNLAEPLTLLAVGTVLCLVNPFMGLPLMFCAASSWLTYAIEVLRGVSPVRDALAKHGYQRAINDEFSTVNN